MPPTHAESAVRLSVGSKNIERPATGEPVDIIIAWRTSLRQRRAEERPKILSFTDCGAA
jgi:hypothetical protein